MAIQTEKVTITIDPKTKATLDTMARELGLTRSSMLRMLVLQRMKQEAKQ